MRYRGVATLVACVAVVVAACGAHALVQKSVYSNDARHAFQIESFGYEPGGHFELRLSDFVLMVLHDYVPPEKIPGKDGFNIAFVLERSTSDSGLRLEDSSSAQCFHDIKAAEKSGDDRIIKLNDRHTWNKRTITLPITVGGYYHLYFSNCEADTQVSFQLELIEYNIDPHTGAHIYLSAGEASLPTWFFFITGVFTLMTIAWVVLLRKHREQVKQIHHLMTVVIVLKVLSVFFESFRYHTLRVSGTHDAWSVFFYIFSFLKGMMMFTVIVLIGTGWSHLKPFLTERDKQIMLVVIVVECMVQIAQVVVGETTPGSAGWLTWRDILHLLDMVCCCVILLPIVWSIRHLRLAAQEDTKDGRAARNMARLTSFRTFYLLVVAYVYFTRIIVYLLGATLPFELTWMSTVFSEAANAAFYGITGYLFRPQARNPYLPLETDADDQELSQTTGAAAAGPADVQLSAL